MILQPDIFQMHIFKERARVVYQTENQIKMTLGINAWRNLLNDKIIRFARLMPDMNPVFMLELVGQLPQFWLFAKDTLQRLEKNESAPRDLIRSGKLKEIRRSIYNDLESEHNSTDDKLYYIEAILLILDQNASREILSEADRKFMITLCASEAHMARTVVIAALTFLGGRLL
jgi:hypothetical protein